MKILLVIEREAPGGTSWVTDAIDEWTLADVGIPDHIQKMLDDRTRAGNVRQAWIEVPDDLFEKVWAVPTFSSTSSASAAPPLKQEPGPWTSHGHSIAGVTVAGPKPADMRVARCGGPGLCAQCSREAGLLGRAASTGEVRGG